MTYSIVLVMKAFTHHHGKAYNNLTRFMNIGMVSYEKYMKREDVKDFFVVVPKDDVALVTTELTKAFPMWPWKIINEESLISSAVPPGWARQQTAKLAISMLVSTDNYLIIDDDTYLTKPFCKEDMYDPDTKKLIMNKTDIDFPFFFFWSSEVLNVDFDEVQYAKTHMAITPEIFVTSVVKDIVRWLVEKYGNQKQWQLYIANNKYTEYCLYWIWLLHHKKADEYYAIESPYQLYDHATTSLEQPMPEMVKKSFKDNKYHWFSFVQSSIDVPVLEIQKEVLSYISHA